MEYSSQYGQDRFIDETVFKRKTHGTFVEIGAYDGVSFSNTYALECFRNWSGICVEPIPERFKMLAANRTAKCYQACVSDKPGNVEFTVLEGDNDREMFSGMKESFTARNEKMIEDPHLAIRTITVPAVTFDSLMADRGFQQVDYISIDTEGHEFAILKTIDFPRFRPGCLTVEENGRFFAIKRYMAKWGYRVVEKLGADLVIVSEPIAAEMRGIGLLNPFNRYKRYAIAALHRIGVKV